MNIFQSKRSQPYIHFFLTIATFVSIVLTWEIITKYIHTAIIPAPLEIVNALSVQLKSNTLPQDIFATLKRVGIGYVIGASSGIVFGILTATAPTIESMLGRVIQLLRSISPVALVPLTLAWFGLDESGKYFLIAWGTFFVVWISVHIGTSTADRHLIWSAQSLGIPLWKIVWVIRPLAGLNVILTGLRTAVSTAMICVLVGEMIGSTTSAGLGYRSTVSYQLFQIDVMFSSILVIGAIGATLDWTFSYVARRFAPWIQLPHL